MRDGDQDAWVRLTYSYGPTVNSWILRFGFQPADAADISQDIFLAAATSLETFERDGKKRSFRRWLRGITHHKSCDFIDRTHKRNEVTYPDFETFVNESDGDDVDEIDAQLTSDLKAGVAHRAAEIVKTETRNPVVWECFWRAAVNDERPSEIAQDLQSQGLKYDTQAVIVAIQRTMLRMAKKIQKLEGHQGD